MRAEPDLRVWIPCPAQFPDRMNRASWAREGARLRWKASGRPAAEAGIQSLADMLSMIHEAVYRDVPCHQIWIHLRWVTQVPLPVCVGIWKSQNSRNDQLAMLSGAADPDTAGRPDAGEFSTPGLGTGIRVLGRKRLDDGTVHGVLGYAFRVDELATDIQVKTSTPDLTRLRATAGDLDDLVRSMTVFTV